MSEQFDSSAIDRIIEEERSRMAIPGLAVAIVDKEGVRYLKGFGSADEAGSPVTGKTTFFIGSSTKSFTAMAIMQLAEKGLLAIEAPVTDYIPGFRLADPEASASLCLKHLMNHSSGISTYGGLAVFGRDSGEPLRDLVLSLGKVRQGSRPGTKFEYSNLNFIILGAVIEAVSGLSYADYLEKNIFGPLGMARSGAALDGTVTAGFSEGHQPILGFIRPTHYRFHGAITPAGYVTSCAEDMATYLMANLRGGEYGGKRLLSAEGLSRMHAKSSPGDSYYGFGWFDGGDLVHHGGSAENYHATMLLLPAEGYGVVTLMNVNDNAINAFVRGDPKKGETVSYDRIQSRIVNELAGRDIVSPIIGHKTGRAYAILDAVLLCLLAGVCAYGAWLLGRPTLALPQLIAFDALLPALLLAGVPRLLKISWRAMFRFAPGFSHVVFALPLALIAAGLVKIVAWLAGSPNV
jgi:CubicO group peptidase (beta-lactamase class C family)